MASSTRGDRARRSKVGDNHQVYHPCLSVLQEPLQRRSLIGIAGVAGIEVAIDDAVAVRCAIVIAGVKLTQ